MKIELLHQILEGEKGVKREGKGTFVLGDEVELTVTLDLGHEAMTVARVRRLTTQAELLTLETHKGERVYVGPDTPVRALRFAEVEGNKVRGAGFMK
jgi:hypothetical protein